MNAHKAVEGRVQFGLLYRCWICDRPVGRVRPYHECVPPPTDVDAYADHVGYLELHPQCRRQDHPCRVVTLGPAITPLHWDHPLAWEDKAQAVEDALARLTQTVDEEDRESDGGFDPLLVLMARVYARTMTPQQALESLGLISPDVLVPYLPEHPQDVPVPVR